MEFKGNLTVSSLVLKSGGAMGSASTDTFPFTGRLLPRVIATTSVTGSAGEIAYSTADSKFGYCTSNGGTFTLFGTGGGTTPGGSTNTLQYNTGSSFGGTSGLTWDSTNLALTLASSTLTGTTSFPPLSLSQTWNNASGVFTGILLSIVNTNSSTSSRLIDLKVGGTSVFNVTPLGQINAGYISGTYGNFSSGIYATYINQPNDTTLYFANAPNVVSSTGVSFYAGGQFSGSGDGIAIALTPTVNQTGSAGFTAFKINTTQTAVGTGSQNLIDAQVGTNTKFKVDNVGVVFATTPAQQIYQCNRFGGF